jgi:hypothetical protein
VIENPLFEKIEGTCPANPHEPVIRLISDYSMSFVPQRHHGIHSGSAARGQITGRQSNNRQYGEDGRERGWVCRADTEKNSRHQARQSECQNQTDSKSYGS